MNIEIEKEVRIHPTERDKRAVLFVAEQGFATVEQLWKAGWRDQRTASYAYERLALLEKAGLLKILRLPQNPLKIYRASGLGRFLASSVASHPVPMTELSSSIALHQLELNEVRLALEARGVSTWRSAESLILDPGFSKLGGRHVPDGFYVSTTGIRTAVEHDRTQRKKERIKERLSDYLAELMSPDRSFERLVYLVSPNLEHLYRPIFEQGFATIKDRTILMTHPNFLKAFQEKAPQ
jgi:hypothetical protein